MSFLFAHSLLLLSKRIECDTVSNQVDCTKCRLLFSQHIHVSPVFSYGLDKFIDCDKLYSLPSAHVSYPDKLRELAWSGVPPYLRPSVWRLLLVNFFNLLLLEKGFLPESRHCFTNSF